VARKVCAMAANRPDPRDAILDRFESGEIDKEQADAEAAAAGFASMERRPDFAGIDCCKLARWTMPPLMAWVIDRTSEAVLALSEEFRMQTRVWQQEDLISAKGEKWAIDWRLRPPDKLTLFDVTAEAVAREEADGRERRALRLRLELYGQFIQGALTAYGKRRGDAEHMAIPKTAWKTIDLFDLPCNHFDLEDVGRESEQTPRYTDVYAIPEEVSRVWPRAGAKPEQAASPRPKTKVPTKPEAIASILLSSFPNGRPSLTNPELVERVEKGAKSEIGDFSPKTLGRAIQIAWPGSSRRGSKSAN
jgi:hypothetical protein